MRTGDETQSWLLRLPSDRAQGPSRPSSAHIIPLLLPYRWSLKTLEVLGPLHGYPHRPAHRADRRGSADGQPRNLVSRAPQTHAGRLARFRMGRIREQPSGPLYRLTRQGRRHCKRKSSSGNRRRRPWGDFSKRNRRTTCNEGGATILPAVDLVDDVSAERRVSTSGRTPDEIPLAAHESAHRSGLLTDITRSGPIETCASVRAHLRNRYCVMCMPPLSRRNRTHLAMEQSDKSASSFSRQRGQPVPNALDEFSQEEPAPVIRAFPRRTLEQPVLQGYNPRRTRSATSSRVPLRSSAKRNRGAWLSLWSVVFGVVCLAVGYVVTPPRFPLSRPAPPATTLQQPTEPPTIIDDTRRGSAVPDTNSLEPIPTELLGPTAGPAQELNTRRTGVSPGAVPTPSRAVAPAFVGSLQIDSMPPSARVFVDRKPVGVTPLRMIEVASGSHVVRLEADGHTPWSSAIRVVANRRTDVHATLAPSREDAQP